MIYGLEGLIERSFEKLGNNRAGRGCREGMREIWPRKTRIQQKPTCQLMRLRNNLKLKVGGGDGGVFLIAKWDYSLCQQQKTSGLINDFWKRSSARVWTELLKWKCYSHYANCELLFKETASYQGCKLKDVTGLIRSWQHYMIRCFIPGCEIIV